MPWSTEHKNNTREKILHHAVEQFSSNGYDNVSISSIMEAAGLTHGTFYAHFASKQSLYAEAITAAARASALAKMLPEKTSDHLDLMGLVNSYLDLSHVLQKQPPCPLAFLATDVTNREDEVRSAYTRVFKRLVALIARELEGDAASKKERALALAATMIGGVAVSRALNEPATVSALLKACRQTGMAMVDANNDCA